MKYIANESKKVKIKMVTEAFNNAKIIKQEIPILKLHNRVPDKEYNHSHEAKVYIAINDIKEHSTNPKKVSNRLRREKQKKLRYTQKKSEYITEIDFTEELDLKGNSKKIANTIKDFVIYKFYNINNNEIKYKFERFREESWSSYNRYDTYSDPYQEFGKYKYFIDMRFSITKYEEKSFTVYYEPMTLFHIHIVKGGKNQKLKSYLKITLEERLDFDFVIII